MNILYNKEKLDHLMNNLSAVSSITVSIFDYKMYMIRDRTHTICEFCQYMRQSKLFCEQCEKSNNKAFKTVERTRAPYLYQCHAGLYELVTPIIAQDSLLGYLMIGQFVPIEKKEQVWKQVQERCCSYGLTLPDKKTFFSQIRLLPHNEIIAWSEIVLACASYIWTNQYLVSLTDKSFQKIEQFVLNNISTPLTIEQLCEATSIPRNRLYNIVKKNTGLTVREYIWLVRIDRAKELLTDTEFSISEIAYQLGTDDYNYFTKVFKKIVGLSPIQYRKRYVNTKYS